MADGLRKPEPLSFEGNVALNWKHVAQEVEIFLAFAHGDKDEKTKAHIFLNLAGREREIVRQSARRTEFR